MALAARGALVVPRVLLALGPPQALQGQAAPAVQAVRVVPAGPVQPVPPASVPVIRAVRAVPVARAAAVVQAAPRVRVERVVEARELRAPVVQVVGVVWAAQVPWAWIRAPCRMGLRVAPVVQADQVAWVVQVARRDRALPEEVRELREAVAPVASVVLAGPVRRVPLG